VRADHRRTHVRMAQQFLHRAGSAAGEPISASAPVRPGRLTCRAFLDGSWRVAAGNDATLGDWARQGKRPTFPESVWGGARQPLASLEADQPRGVWARSFPGVAANLALWPGVHGTGRRARPGSPRGCRWTRAARWRPGGAERRHTSGARERSTPTFLTVAIRPRLVYNAGIGTAGVMNRLTRPRHAVLTPGGRERGLPERSN
jgi:hypothetical protein